MEFTESSWPRRTERLTVRPLTEADLDAMFAYRSQPAVYEWIGRAYTDPAAFRERMLTLLADPALLNLAIELDGALVGDTFLKLTDGWAQDDLAPARRSQAEFGYAIDPRYAGRGFATEVSRELIRIAFTELGLRRLTAGCFADNQASRRVLEKAGLRLEAVTRKECLHRDRGWLDGCLFAILAEEWSG
ncbi:GNAT family N-acetyltransferase [Enemella evansiae]|uniref:GNAT family N-acetyltransferase n=1 Tax=Enemella evansiae TaxID=2016499 RepID=UPI000B971078|nr:GNAT family N-acetyltransferase [Enemella evansiae]OYO14145.1 GNAT family N-acetyltransferase [Enemella evansiae]